MSAVLSTASTGTPTRLVLPRYLLVALSARIADEGARISLILLALQRGSSAATGGLLVAALLVPHVVAAPLVGAAVDRSRHPRRVLAVAVGVFGAALLAAVPLLGRGPLWLTLGVLLVGGCCGPAITGGLSSALPDLVHPDAVGRAFGLDSMFYNVASMAGPALVGVLVAVAGAGLAQVALGGCAALAAVGLLTLPIAKRPGRLPGRASLTAGVREILRQPTLRAVTVSSAIGQIGPGGLGVVAAVLATALHAPAMSGLLLTAVAAGSLGGSLLWAVRPARPEHAPLVATASMLGIGVPLLAVPLVRSAPALVGLFALAGVCIGPFAAALFATRTAFSSEGARTQVFTIGAGLKVSAAALGAVLFGLATGLPVPAQVVLLAASPLAAGLGGTAVLLAARTGPARILRRRHSPEGHADAREGA